MTNISILFIILLNFNPSFSWDTTAAKYFPLQIGNIWVYRGTATQYLMNGRSYQVYKVTGTIDTLGKKYYLVQVRTVMISGTISPGVMQLGNLVRIDSATMIVCKPQAFCEQPEFKIDSIKSKLNDSMIVCRYQYFNGNSTCVDTSFYFIFNQNLPSKKFIEFYGPGHSTVYVKGIGIVYNSYGYQMNSYHDSLRGCIINGILYGDTSTLVGINKISSEVPEQFSLSQNYPNPFNPNSKIKFEIAKMSESRIIVFDILGREVTTLVNDNLSPGTYEVEFDGLNYAGGIYYYTLSAGDYFETKKMVLIK